MSLLILLGLVLASNAQIGHLGQMIGLQKVCDDFFCQTSHFSVMNYTFPPPAFNKGYEMVQVTPAYPALTDQDMAKYTAYDSNTANYYMLMELPGEGENDYILYTANLNTLKVTSVPMSQALQLQCTSMQYDIMTKTLFAVFNSDMYTIDPLTGNLTKRGPLNGGQALELEPSLTTYFDTASGVYYIAVDDQSHGTHNLLSYFTRNNTIYLSPNLNNGDTWTLYGIAFDPTLGKSGLIVALTSNLRGYPSVKYVDPIKGNHTDLISEFIWSDYDYDFFLWPLSPQTNNPLTILDLNKNIFWMTVMYVDPESTADDDALVYYNLTKGGDEMGSGPMVIYDNAIELTNYVWFGKDEMAEW